MGMKMRLEIRSRSQRYDINRHEHKYIKYRMCLSISNIRSWVHEKVKQHWGWVKKRRVVSKRGFL